ncbi:MAG: DUF2282 domain-containing protein [Burkholderiales bacterium]|nr:DUF2282 domain-containing protein [Burkholderiales bacterium]
MKTTQLIISSAIAGLVSLATSGLTVAQDKPAAAAKEKCYGVAKKGANDCGTAKHSCAGQAAADNTPEEWKFVAKGTCESMKGSLKKPGGTTEAPKQSY